MRAYPTGWPYIHVAARARQNTQKGIAAVSRYRKFPLLKKIMKRHAHLWEKIIDKNNLRIAIKKACRSNGRNSFCKKVAINRIKENPDRYVNELYELLSSNKFKTSRYYIYPLYEPKLRLIYCLPFYPDR